MESFMPKHGKILDFGCGYGLLSNLLALKGKNRKVIGIDLDNGRIRKAKRSSFNRKNISFHAISLEEFSEKDFDAIVLTDVLHHINDTDVKRLIHDFIERLKENGIIVILDVDKTPFLKYLIAHSVDRILNPVSELHFRSATDMKQVLSSFPIEIEEIIPADKNLPLPDIIYMCRRT